MSRKIMTETFGKIDDAFITEALEYRRERSRITMSKKKLATIIIAAAVTILMSVSVVSATFTGLVGKDNALIAAMEHVVQSAETAEEADRITSYILAGETYVEMFEEQQVDLGLSNFRAVYNISFRLGEYYYEIAVDAKTGVVISCERKVDMAWWIKHQSGEAEYLEGEALERYLTITEKFRSEVNFNDLYLIARGYTGLYALPQSGRYDTEACKSYDQGHDVLYGFEVEDLPEAYDEYSTWCYMLFHGGYKYSVYIDSVTGEVLGCDITEYDDYEGERHLHEASGEHISPYQARQIFTEETGIDYNSDWRVAGVSFVSKDRGFLTDSGWAENAYGKDIYYVSFTMKFAAGGEQTVCIIDAKTGEIIETGNSSKELTKAVSTEAPDGMISEAEALVIVLEDLGITERYVNDFTVELKEPENPNESYYEINISVYVDSAYIYKVDAVSGQILDKCGR